MGGGGFGHQGTALAQSEVWEAPVEHAVRVENLTVPHEMNLPSNHGSSLGGGFLCIFRTAIGFDTPTLSATQPAVLSDRVRYSTSAAARRCRLVNRG
jgi:hypothetical protein